MSGLPCEYAPSINRRLQIVEHLLIMIREASTASEDFDDADRRRAALTYTVTEAIEQLYWVRRLPSSIGNLPAPSDDDVERATGSYDDQALASVMDQHLAATVNRAPAAGDRRNTEEGRCVMTEDFEARERTFLARVAADDELRDFYLAAKSGDKPARHKLARFLELKETPPGAAHVRLSTREYLAMEALVLLVEHGDETNP